MGPKCYKIGCFCICKVGGTYIPFHTLKFWCTSQQMMACYEAGSPSLQPSDFLLFFSVCRPVTALSPSAGLAKLTLLYSSTQQHGQPRSFILLVWAAHICMKGSCKITIWSTIRITVPSPDPFWQDFLQSNLWQHQQQGSWGSALKFLKNVLIKWQQQFL